jgi:hypothetical protein
MKKYGKWGPRWLPVQEAFNHLNRLEVGDLEGNNLVCIQMLAFIEDVSPSILHNATSLQNCKSWFLTIPWNIC